MSALCFSPRNFMPSLSSCSLTPTSSAPPLFFGVFRGQAPRLPALVEGRESRRADPRIPHGNGAGRARKCPRRGHFADTSRTPSRTLRDAACAPSPPGLDSGGRSPAANPSAPVPSGSQKIVFAIRRSYVQISRAPARQPRANQPMKPRHLDRAPNQAQTVGFLQVSPPGIGPSPPHPALKAIASAPPLL